MASGVPTCIHTPSSRSPCSRPASAARSNSARQRERPGRRVREQLRRAASPRRHRRTARPRARRAASAGRRPPSRSRRGRHSRCCRPIGASSSSASMLAGSNASASRSRLGCTPSIQIVSELTWKNGSLPSCGSALTTPPPVSSSLPRSSEITICGALRAREVPLDLVGEIMHVDHRALDAGCGQPVEHMIDQRLAGDRHQRLRHACRSAAACARRGRRPAPWRVRGQSAGWDIDGHAPACRLRLDRASAPARGRSYQSLQRRQRRMRQRALQIAPYPRDVSEILRLAVAPVEPREDAEDFRGALRGERGVGLDELGRVELRIGSAARCGRSGRAARPPAAPARRRAHPAAARRGRRPPAPSRRPGNRAGRRGRCRCAPAARSGWANGSRAAPRSAWRRSPACSASRHSAT